MLAYLYETAVYSQAQIADDARSVQRLALDATGLPGCVERCQSLCVCTWQDEQSDAPATGDLCRHPYSLWFACANGLQCPSSGWCHLQSPLDKSPTKCAGTSGRLHEETLQGIG